VRIIVISSFFRYGSTVSALAIGQRQGATAGRSTHTGSHSKEERDWRDGWPLSCRRPARAARRIRGRRNLTTTRDWPHRIFHEDSNCDGRTISRSGIQSSADL